jgi:hypothetical protein
MRATCVFVALCVCAGALGGRARAGEPIVELRVATSDGKFHLITPVHTAQRLLAAPILLANGPLNLSPPSDLVTAPAIAGPLGVFHDMDTKTSGRGLLALHLEL